MTVVIGTAGHIDHGKTALLRALTGIDADRLPEERARGLTIDVGYAHLALDDGTELDFVDVPGHDRLVGNMLVGAGEIDAVVLVVAADDGPRAQTLEHVHLLDALGIDHGLAVVTKVDAVGPERVAAVIAATRLILAGTSLDGAPVAAASSLTSDGLQEVRTLLAALRDRVMSRPVPPEPLPSRLAIDRVFPVRGRGTVVTGTLRGGAIERGAILRVVPGPPDAAVRVREVQVHGRTVERTGPGRAALNVAVVGPGVRLERGVVLTGDPAVRSTDRALVVLDPPLADRTRATLHLGTSRVEAIVGASGRDAVDLASGGRTAIVRLDRRIAAAPGDRFVLRRPSPAATLAGGLVVDPEPPRGVARRRATPERIRALVGASAAEERMAARLGLHGVLADGSDVLLAPDLGDQLDAAIVATVTERGTVGAAELARFGERELRRHVGPTPGLAGLVAGRLATLTRSGRLERASGDVRLPGTAGDDVPPAVAAAMDRLVATLAVAAPPPLRDAAIAVACPPEGIRRLEREGRIVRLEDDLAWSAATYEELTGRALALAEQAPLTPAGLRDATGTSRRYVMAILEDLDRRAVLRRTPAGHVPGPRSGSSLPTIAADT